MEYFDKNFGHVLNWQISQGKNFELLLMNSDGNNFEGKRKPG